MIDRLAERIAVYLKRHNEDIVSIAVMKFSLIIILNVVFVFSLVLIFGAYTNSFGDSLLAIFGFALLRFFSGGKHVKSAVYCLIISLLLFSIIIYVPVPQMYKLWMQIISTLLVIIFAPAHLENHIRIKKSYIPFLRIMSICIVCSNFFWYSDILTKCFFLQSISLIEIRKKGD